MINIDDSLLIYSNTNKRYELLPIANLGNLYVTQQAHNSTFEQLESKIYELSLYILDLSASFIRDYYCFEELDKKFELLSDAEYMVENPEYLTDEESVKLIVDKYNIPTITETERTFDKLRSDITKDLSRKSKSLFKL